MSTPMTPTMVAAPAADARRPLLVALSLLALFLAAMDSTVVGTLLPVMKAQMQDESLFPWLMSSFILASVLATPLTGRLADVLGEKTAMIGALAVFLAGSLAVWYAQTMPWLIAARALQGVGAGAVSVMSYVVIGRLFDEAGRAKMQGLLSLVWGVAAILGPLLGALIDREWGWRMVFLLNVPACVLIIGLLAVLYPARAGQAGAKAAPLDLITTLSFVGALGAALTLIMAGSLSLGHAGTALLGALLAACLLVQTWRVRGDARRSLIPMAFLSQRRHVLPALHTVVASITLYAAVTLLPLYLHGREAAGSSVEGGVLVMAAALGWVVGAAVCGGLLAKTGFKATALIGSVFLLVGALGLSQAQAHILIGASLACIGLGIGFVATTSLVLVQNQAPQAELGSYTSAIHLCRNAGAALGINVVAALQIASWQQLSRTGGLDAWRQSFSNSFGFLVALTALGCLLAIAIPAKAQRDAQRQGGKA